VEYNYIVIGGGSAGSTVASRLSEDRNASVLLLEAGEDWRSQEAPAELRSSNFFKIAMKGEYNWSTLQGTLTTAKPPEPYLVGKGLGGGSSINGQIWMRPPLDDYDHWAALGCTGWSSEEVLPYLKKSEQDELRDRSYHGNQGPIPVWRPKDSDRGSVDCAFYDAVIAVGHAPSPDLDLNAPGATGLSAIPLSVRHQQRVTTNDAYLEPARDRPNLTIVGQALVDKILFNGMTAIGVKVLIDGAIHAYRGQHIVLCAGAIYSPAILMRSGIGSADKIRGLGRTVVADLPSVGSHLKDHPMLSVTFPLIESARMPSSDSLLSSFYLQWNSGMEDAKPNDLVIFPMNLVGAEADAIKTGGLILDLFHIHSQGCVNVTSLDPTQDPAIWVGMLSDRRDLIRLRQGVRHLFELARSSQITALADAPIQFAPRGKSGRPLDEFKEDSTLESAMLKYCAQFFHPVGTCRMGASDDPDAVVDPDGRVIGVENLTIADASIMPDIVRANTNVTTVMIAEVIADKLKQSS
jgi:5-(hydroxymethyl)furfural/furfural oxidase